MVTPGLQEIDHNGRVFADLVALASARAEAGRHRSALEWCRTAAGFATTNPIGVLRSSEIELAVDIVARALPSFPRWRPSGQQRKVLHVLSEAAPIGGLTRLVERWIQHDASSISSVVLTRQDSVSERLQVAVTQSGGTGIGLADNEDSFERASKLRGLGYESDLVICHLQSDDAIACAAFGRGYQGAPVAFANHGDHTFWMAPTQTRLIISNRDVGQLLSVQARGYAESFNRVLPLLVPDRQSNSSRQHVRSNLGIPDDRPLAISVARAVKFQDTDLRPRFSDLLSAVLDSVPELVFCAVGPMPSEEPWISLQQQYGDRVIVTGPVQDPQPLLDAADIYLDTFPFSSTTSLLEASANSLAVVTFDGHVGLRKALGISTFVFQSTDRPTDIEGLSSRIKLLARDTSARQESARAARSVHDGYSNETQWQLLLQQMYAALDQKNRLKETIHMNPAPTPDARLLDYCTALWAIELRTPLQWRILANLHGFDLRDRLRWTARCSVSRVLARAGKDRASEAVLRPSPSNHVSPTEVPA